MNHLDLFSGIGGFALAASWVWPDYNPVAFCEIDPFCQKVLKKHWPDVPVIPDIRKIRQQKPLKMHTGYDYGTVDLISGGFPCQPFSAAGKRAGTRDDRYLWPEMLRVISEIRPRWVVAENVSGLVSIDKGLVLERVLTDLESEGYQVQPFVIPACAVGAPHRRDRIWIVGYSQCPGGSPRREGCITEQAKKQNGRHGSSQICRKRGKEASIQGCDVANPTQQLHNRPGIELETGREEHSDGGGDVADTGLLRPPKHEKQAAWIEQCGEDATDTRSQRLQGGQQQAVFREGRWKEGRAATQCRDAWDKPWIEAAQRFCRVAHGLPRGMDRTNRLKALGNAIVPQVAAEIFKAIKEADK